MANLKKLLAQYGDKLFLVIVIIYALIQIIGAVKNIAIVPKVVEDARKEVKRIPTTSPAPPQLGETKYDDVLKEVTTWKPRRINTRREIFYNKIEGKLDARAGIVDELLKNHKHFLYEEPIVIDGKNVRHCIFPGCQYNEPADKVILGKVDTLKVHHVTPTKVVLKWDPPENALCDITHCEVQRRLIKSNGKKTDWEFILDDEGEVRKFMLGGGSREEAPAAGRATPKRERKEIDANEFGGLLDDGPSLVPDAERRAPRRERAVRDPAEASDQEEELPEPEIQNLSRIFLFRDKNVDSGKTYEYRVRAHAIEKEVLNAKDFAVEEEAEKPEPKKIVGEWPDESKEEEKKMVLLVKILGIEKIKFVRYYPAWKPNQPDSVVLTVSEYFNPPWDAPKFLMTYKIPKVPVGTEDKSIIGKKFDKYLIRSKEGEQVYFNDIKNEFRYVNDAQESTKEDIASLTSRRNWKKLRLPVDFSTGFKALKVEEKIEELKTKTTKLNLETGKNEIIIKVKKLYRYYLHIENIKTKEVKKLELLRPERELTKRIGGDR